MCFPTQQTPDQFHGSEAPSLIFLYFLTQLLPLAVVQQPLLAVYRDSSCLFSDTQLYMVALGPSLPRFPPLTLLLCSHQARQYFSAGQRAEGMNAAFGTRGWCQPAVTQWGTVSYHLWPFHYQSECSHPIWVVSKIKTPAGKISCQDFLWKMVLSKKSKGDGTSSNVFPR